VLSLPERQVFHAIRKVFRIIDVGEKCQITYALTYGHLELMGIDHAGKKHATLQPLCRLA
jgi:hypothetical protein